MCLQYINKYKASYVDILLTLFKIGILKSLWWWSLNSNLIMSLIWSNEACLLLVDFMKRHEVLWNARSKDYWNKTLRHQDLESAVVVLKDKVLGVNAPEIIKRIKSWKAQYRREKKKVAEWAKCGVGETTLNTWWLYDKLQFFSDGEGSESTFTNMEVNQSSENSSARITVRRWTVEACLLLVDCMKNHEALWNTASIDYHNKDIKYQALLNTVALLKDKIPGVYCEEVLRRIKSWKAKYNMEKRKYMESVTRGEDISDGNLTTWWLYDKLHFLNDCEANESTLTNMTVKPPSEHASTGITWRDCGANESTLTNMSVKPPLETALTNMTVKPPSENVITGITWTPDCGANESTLTNMTVKPHSEHASTGIKWRDWTAEACFLLVDFMRSHETLWNTSSPEYWNKFIKYKALESAVALLKDKVPGVDSGDVSKRIKAWKIQYSRERKKLTEAAESGADVGEFTTWWLYDDLHFLSDCEGNKETFTNMTVKPTPGIVSIR